MVCHPRIPDCLHRRPLVDCPAANSVLVYSLLPSVSRCLSPADCRALRCGGHGGARSFATVRRDVSGRGWQPRRRCGSLWPDHWRGLRGKHDRYRRWRRTGRFHTHPDVRLALHHDSRRAGDGWRRPWRMVAPRLTEAPAHRRVDASAGRASHHRTAARLAARSVRGRDRLFRAPSRERRRDTRGRRQPHATPLLPRRHQHHDLRRPNRSDPLLPVQW